MSFFVTSHRELTLSRLPLLKLHSQSLHLIRNDCYCLGVFEGGGGGVAL